MKEIIWEETRLATSEQGRRLTPNQQELLRKVEELEAKQKDKFIDFRLSAGLPIPRENPKKP